VGAVPALVGALVMDDNKLWVDAYQIAYIGGSNKRAIANALINYTKQLGSKHVAVRAIAGHLLYLYGYDLGPEITDLNKVLAKAVELGIA